MSKVINFTTLDVPRAVRHKRSSKEQCENVICAHCKNVINVKNGEVAISCFGVTLHEEHFTEYCEDFDDEGQRCNSAVGW